MRSMRLNVFATACALSVLLLTACGGNSPGDFCSVYQPVYSSSDSLCDERIREQVDGNNAVFLCSCIEDEVCDD